MVKDKGEDDDAAHKFKLGGGYGKQRQAAHHHNLVLKKPSIKKFSQVIAAHTLPTERSAGTLFAPTDMTLLVLYGEEKVISETDYSTTTSCLEIAVWNEKKRNSTRGYNKEKRQIFGLTDMIEYELLKRMRASKKSIQQKSHSEHPAKEPLGASYQTQQASMTTKTPNKPWKRPKCRNCGRRSHSSKECPQQSESDSDSQSDVTNYMLDGPDRAEVNAVEPKLVLPAWIHSHPVPSEGVC